MFLYCNYAVTLNAFLKKSISILSYNPIFILSVGFVEPLSYSNIKTGC